MSNNLNNLTISREAARTAYDNTDDAGRKLLEHLFGKEIFTKDIKERIKTFEDARKALGDEHPLVKEYFDLDITQDLNAYLKLRIITAALNEGWEPQFTVDEYRYYPWFALFTQKEIDKMSDDDKSRVVGRAGSSSNASGGLACANEYYASSSSDGYIGSRLAFRTRELAEYAGRQFIELYADFVFPVKA